MNWLPRLSVLAIQSWSAPKRIIWRSPISPLLTMVWAEFRAIFRKLSGDIWTGPLLKGWNAISLGLGLLSRGASGIDLLSNFHSLEFHNEQPCSPHRRISLHDWIHPVWPTLSIPKNSSSSQSTGQRNIAIWSFIGNPRGLAASRRNAHYSLLSRCCDVLHLYHNADLWQVGQSIFQFGLLPEINEQMSIDFLPTAVTRLVYTWQPRLYSWVIIWSNTHYN